MSHNDSSAPNIKNLELFRNLAAKLLKVSPDQKESITHPEDLVNLIIEHHLRELQLPAFHTKIESSVHLNLEQDSPQVSKISHHDNDLWVFGYGSLVWKADFPYVARLTGYIKGFERRFYQNSIDHRGTAERPGRVVTLIPSTNPDSRVWGVAYQIAEDDKENVLKHLDFREKNGYQRHNVRFYPFSQYPESLSNTVNVTIYVADHTNESFAGHIHDVDRIADQAYSAVGPSGTNREYVYKLANAMRQLFPGKSDEHLFELEQRLREREARDVKLNQDLREEIAAIVDLAAKDENQNFDNLENSIRRKFNEFRTKLGQR